MHIHWPSAARRLNLAGQVPTTIGVPHTFRCSDVWKNFGEMIVVGHRSPNSVRRRGNNHGAANLFVPLACAEKLTHNAVVSRPGIARLGVGPVPAYRPPEQQDGDAADEN